MLLELARLFSRLYTYKRTHAAYVTAGRGGGTAHAPRSNCTEVPGAPGLELSPTRVLHPRDTGSRLGPSGTEWVGPGMPLAPHGAWVASQSVHGAGTGTPCSEGSGLRACGRPAPPRGSGLASTADTCSPHAARYNLLFFASGGGKFNYQGTKRWLEDNLDHTGERPRGAGAGGQGRRGAPPLAPPNRSCCHADSSLLQDNVAFVLCLDTVGRGDSLHLHVSKPPREGTLQHAFLRELETVGARARARCCLGSLAPRALVASQSPPAGW